MVTTPGIFCEAIVTINKGTATLISTPRSNTGVIHWGLVSAQVSVPGLIKFSANEAAIPNAKTAKIAYRAVTRLAIKYTANIPSTNIACALVASTASKAKRANTPANIADASAVGILSINRANKPLTPANTINSPQNTNAPIACGRLTPARLVTSSAAPGVDHATMTGCLYQRDKPKVHKPMPKLSAPIQEPICAGLAPAA